MSGSNSQDWNLNGVPHSYNNGEGSRIVQSGGPTQVTMSWSLSYGARSNQAAVAIEPAPSDSSETTVYYYANKELVAKKDNSGNKTYIHSDHLGSTSVVTNQAGSVVESTKYDPWGEIVSGGTTNKFLYTGQEHDGETGLHYYNARYYNPDIRRFTQADPIIQNVYDPQMLNRYSYVRNNPLRYTDPSGNLIFPAIVSAIRNILGGNNSKPAPPKQAKPDAGVHKPTSGGSVPLSKVTGASSSNSGNSNSMRPQAPAGVNINQNIKEAERHKINLSIFEINKPHTQTKNAYNALWFVNKVRPGGDWDYKNKYGGQYENFGNFNYGATGKASGYPTFALQSMAGVVQQLRGINNSINKDPMIPTSGVPFLSYPYGDAAMNGRSIDQEMTRSGADYYDQHW